MSRILRVRPTVLGVVAAFGVLALAGCGAGQISQTAEQQSGSGGANIGTNSTIVVRDAVIEYSGTVEDGQVHPVGGSAPLRMWIVNQGTATDRLVSASSPAAASVQVSGETEVPGGQVLVVESPPAATTGPATTTPQPGASPTAAPTAAPTASPSPTSTPAALGAPGQDRVAQIVLVGLREEIRAGLTYPVVLVFEGAGEIRFDIPVGNPEEPREPAEE